MYTTKETGKKYTPSYKCYIYSNDIQISPLHDIPLKKGQNVMCLNEIPRFINAKFELNKNLPKNPITQDIKKGVPRFVSNIYPFHGYPWNYGCLPRTWEDPNETDEFCDAKGDNDPLDVIEVGSKRKKTGEVYEAKVLGCLGLLDDGECDWKILVIDVNDEKASVLNDIDDVENFMPGLLNDTIFWFMNYKVADGKGKNAFLERKFYDKERAMKVIENAHVSYCKLVKENVLVNEDKEVDIKEKEDDGDLPEHLGGFFYLKKD